MFYCIASIRKLADQKISEITGLGKGATKGSALVEMLKDGGIILWLEEISRDDYERINDAINKGELIR
jgi:hypothetical protein